MKNITRTNYLFVDEVQMYPKFELAINSQFSFQEYCKYYDEVNDKDKLFDDKPV